MLSTQLFLQPRPVLYSENSFIGQERAPHAEHKRRTLDLTRADRQTDRQTDRLPPSYKIYLMKTGWSGVGAGVHDVNAVTAKGGQHQLVASLGGIPVAATAHIPAWVVQFVTHRGHLQAVDHLKHGETGRVRSQSYGTCCGSSLLTAWITRWHSTDCWENNYVCRRVISRSENINLRFYLSI